MNPWRHLTQFAFLAAAVAVLAQNQNSLPGPPASGVEGGLAPKPAVLQGLGTSFLGTPGQRTGSPRYMPFATSLTMGVGDARREKLALYFCAQYQRQNVADTNRLVSLAGELNAASEQPGGTLTTAEMKKVEQIEKLAKRVRERLTVP